MLSKIITKSLIALALIASLLASLTSKAIMTEGLNLRQIRDLQIDTLKKLKLEGVSSEQKLDLIQQQRYIAEMSLRKLIQEKRINIAKISKAGSDVAVAFEVVDNLVFLSELKLDSAGKVMADSCIKARGLLDVNLLNPNQEIQQLTAEDKSLSKIIDLLCK